MLFLWDEDRDFCPTCYPCPYHIQLSQKLSGYSFCYIMTNSFNSDLKKHISAPLEPSKHLLKWAKGHVEEGEGEEEEGKEEERKEEGGQETGRKYWATRSSVRVRLLARIAHSFALHSAQSARVLRCAHSFAHSLTAALVGK